MADSLVDAPILVSERSLPRVTFSDHESGSSANVVAVPFIDLLAARVVALELLVASFPNRDEVLRTMLDFAERNNDSQRSLVSSLIKSQIISMQDFLLSQQRSSIVEFYERVSKVEDSIKALVRNEADLPIVFLPPATVQTTVSLSVASSSLPPFDLYFGFSSFDVECCRPLSLIKYTFVRSCIFQIEKVVNPQDALRQHISSWLNQELPAV